MWNNDDDVNDSGEPVELYLPVQAPPRKTNINPKESHIGGLPCFDESFVPCCDLCGDKMFLLAQLKLDFSKEMERYLCTFSCVKEECFREISYEKGFASSSVGLKGVVKCIEKRVSIDSSESKAKIPVTGNTKSSWYDDDNDDGKKDDDDDDDWGMGGDNDIDLENAVAAMEGKLDGDGAIVMAPSKKTAGKSKAPSSDEALQNAFGCYLLKQQPEPVSSKSFLEDEDDVGLSESDEKIRNMLARYMAEEEDEDILAALGGTSLGGGCGNNGEEDERLSEEDRVLRTFQDRQKRAPRQVIRYASGGKPLWSIPDKNRKSGKILWSVPESLRFEFQVLPSILAALEVDQHPATKTTSAKTGDDEKSSMALDQLLSNGVNFGSIAVFTDHTSGGEQEAFVVIQKSVDDLPVLGNKSAAASGEGLPAASMAVVEDLDDDEEFQLDA